MEVCLLEIARYKLMLGHVYGGQVYSSSSMKIIIL
jgi:hypothetical protein